MPKRIPTPKPAAQAAATTLTSTTGYFNGNKFPLTINSNQLALNVTLAPGEFIRERLADGGRGGRNINDSRLDGFLAAGGLTKQIGDPVPEVLINTTGGKGIGVSATAWKPQAMPQPRAINPVQQVQRAPTKVLIQDRITPPAGGTMPPRPHAPSPAATSPLEVARERAGFSGGPAAPLKSAAVGVTPAGINPAVRAMSVAEAEARGIIRRARPPVEGPSASDGLDAKGAPYVDEVGTPGVIRRQQQQESVAPARKGPQVTISTPVGAPAPAPAPAPVVLTDAEAVQIPESNIYEGADNLPDPDIAPAPLTLTESDKPFVCAADGKAFKTLVWLRRYVKEKYPDRTEELLSAYQA